MNKTSSGYIIQYRIGGSDMKKILLILLAAFIIISCEDGSGGGNDNDDSVDKGYVTINMTDAPVDTDNLVAVNINVTEIRANIAGADDDGWQVLKTFDPGLDINLLDYTGGISLALAEEVELPAGKVNQIRFILDSPEEGDDGSNPGCYLEYDDSVIYPLYIPSGSSSGFKAVGSFDIPVNGSVTVTADFDVRKSLVDSGGDVYKLKPVIRLIIDNEAGKIKGTVTEYESPFDYTDWSVYAYEDDSYSSDEQTPDSDGMVMTDAVNSCPLKDDGSYTLPFLEEGTYDIVVVRYNPDIGFGDYTKIEEDVDVTAGDTTTQDINLTPPFPVD